MASRPAPAANIMPSGIPLDVVASGSEIAGSPVALCHGVNVTHSRMRSITVSKSLVGSRWPTSGVSCARVGVSTTS